MAFLSTTMALGLAIFNSSCLSLTMPLLESRLMSLSMRLKISGHIDPNSVKEY